MDVQHMDRMKRSIDKLLGLRTIKTFLAVLISSLLMQYVFGQNPFFACIGAVVAMERTIASSVQAALVRNIGTLTGAAVGIAIASFTEDILLLSLGVFPLIWVSRMLHRKESIVPGAIVYFAVAYLNTMDHAWVYGVTRFCGTLLGTVIAIAINLLILPPPKPESPAA